MDESTQFVLDTHEATANPVSDDEPILAEEGILNDKEMINKKENYKSFVDDGAMLLMDAAQRGDTEAIRVALGQGIDVNISNKEGKTALHIAASYGSRATVSFLIEQGANLEAKTRIGHTPLLSACECGQKEMVELLLHLGADITVCEKGGANLLHFSLLNGDEEIFHSLLGYGLNVNAKVVEGFTVLHSAIIYDRIRSINLLLEHGADIEHPLPNGITPLMAAMQANKEEIVDILVKHRANMQAVDAEGRTLLHYAALGGVSSRLMGLVLENRADIEATFGAGITPLMCAVDNNHETTVKFLLQRGANIQVVDSNGRTLLHHATFLARNPLLVSLMLENGVGVGKVDKTGKNALDYAQQIEHMEIIELLIGAVKADPQEQSQDLEQQRQLQPRLLLRLFDELQNHSYEVTQRSKDLALQAYGRLLPATLDNSLLDKVMESSIRSAKLLHDEGRWDPLTVRQNMPKSDPLVDSMTKSTSTSPLSLSATRANVRKELEQLIEFLSSNMDVNSVDHKRKGDLNNSKVSEAEQDPLCQWCQKNTFDTFTLRMLEKAYGGERRRQLEAHALGNEQFYFWTSQPLHSGYWRTFQRSFGSVIGSAEKGCIFCSFLVAAARQSPPKKPDLCHFTGPLKAFPDIHKRIKATSELQAEADGRAHEYFRNLDPDWTSHSTWTEMMQGGIEAGVQPESQLRSFKVSGDFDGTNFDFAFTILINEPWEYATICWPYKLHGPEFGVNFSNHYFRLYLTEPHIHLSDFTAVTSEDTLRHVTGIWDAYDNQQPSSQALLRDGKIFQSLLEDCVANHKTCTPNTNIQMPSRLLQLSGSITSPAVRLVNVQNISGPIMYACLSYCWGGPQPGMTTESRLDKYSKHLNLAIVPKTVQDAIKVTMSLALKFLWVDSYCIVQDSASDKTTELGNMSSIYSGAYCTIAAMSAKASSEGFLESYERLSSDTATLNIDITNDILPRRIEQLSPRCAVLEIRKDFAKSDTQDQPLLARAWTLQESLLSPRLIMFFSDGQRPVLRCNSRTVRSDGGIVPRIPSDLNTLDLQNFNKRNEPEEQTLRFNLYTEALERLPSVFGESSFAQEDLFTDFQGNHPNKTMSRGPDYDSGKIDFLSVSQNSHHKNIEEAFLKAWAAEQKGKEEQSTSEEEASEKSTKVLREREYIETQNYDTLKASRTWHTIVQEYSKRDMTNPTDKLPALMGVVAMMEVGDSLGHYVAGLWSKTLARDLLWEVNYRDPVFHLVKKAELRAAYPIYIGPSWSWVSRKHAVYYSAGFVEEPAFQIIAFDLVPTNFSLPNGSLQSASITVRCPATEVIVSDDWKDGEHDFHFDDNPRPLGIKKMWILQVMAEEPYNNRHSVGLGIVEARNNSSQGIVYKRVGLYRKTPRIEMETKTWSQRTFNII